MTTQRPWNPAPSLIRARRLLPLLAEAAIAAAGPAAAQGGQVSPAAYASIMKSESFGIRSYKGAAGEKALAACINWSQSKGDRIAWKELGYQYKARTAAIARAEALQHCARNAQTKKIEGCTCHIIDVNGQYAQ